MANYRISMNIPTTTLSLNALTPHPENYNNHPASQIKGLAESLTTFGQFKNIVVWTCLENMTTPDGHELHEGLTYILAGHGLWLAAMEAGIDELEVKDYSGVSYEIAIGLLLIDNAAHLGSELDSQRLAALLGRTRAISDDRPGLRGMLEQLGVRAGVNGNEEDRDITKSGRLYNAGEGHDIEPFKLAYRIEAIWRTNGNKAIDLYSGQGQLAAWYKRRFKEVITVDKNTNLDNIDFSMDASEFIRGNLSGHLDFDFIDFDDEGTPAREIQELFRAITGKKTESFILALTDGNGFNLKCRGKLDWGEIYLMNRSGVRKATLADYEAFENTVTDFMVKCAMMAKFTPTMLSSYRGREGNVVYQTWLIEPQLR